MALPVCEALQYKYIVHMYICIYIFIISYILHHLTIDKKSHSTHLKHHQVIRLSPPGLLDLPSARRELPCRSASLGLGIEHFDPDPV